MTEQERDLLERVLGGWSATDSALEFRVSAIPYDLPLSLPSFESQQVVGSVTLRGRAPGGPQSWEVHLNTLADPGEVWQTLRAALAEQGWPVTSASELHKGDLTLTARTETRRGLTRLALRVQRQPGEQRQPRP